MVEISALRAQHQDGIGRAERLRETLIFQLTELLATNDIALGVPVESRVKSWASIEEKLQRKALGLSNIFDLEDLVGIRLILLFKTDLEKVLSLIRNNLKVVSEEDTFTRLGEAEFGYQSQHLIVQLPKAWASLPTLASLDNIFVELQVRTLAQHMWAAASHKLQYKQKAGVPPPLRRTINRISALLETVDLEFERVLEERHDYMLESLSMEQDQQLNVDNLASLLVELLPPENKVEHENYSDLLSDLAQLGVLTIQNLREVIERNKSVIEAAEMEMLRENLNKEDPMVTERLLKGVFFAHVGLVRQALYEEFGKDRVRALIDKRTGIARKRRPRQNDLGGRSLV